MSDKEDFLIFYYLNLLLTRFSTKILVIRLVNGGWAGGRVYPKWRQTEVSVVCFGLLYQTCYMGSLYQEAAWDCYPGVCD